ncbi:MAG: hypothetical protein ABIO56_16960 [Ferruginibacter sp.]
MRVTIFFISLLLTNYCFGQSSRLELANSKIYVCATYFEQKNKYIGLETKTILNDTIIDNKTFTKFKTENFTDYSEQKTTRLFYEAFKDNYYYLLDSSLKTIHKINYLTNSPQTGTIFGKTENVVIEFIDTRNSFPRDSLVATNKTPRKYFVKSNSEIYLVIIPDLKTLAVSSNGNFYTKQLLGDNYNNISNGFKNHTKASNKFDIKIGDEIQLFYRRKWYNDTTGLTEYEDKQFKNVKYVGDTIISNSKALVMTINGYSYLNGSTDNDEQFLVSLTDSGYYSGYQFIPFKEYATELRLIEFENKKEFFLQGIDNDTLGTNIYQKIVQAKSNDPYRYYILPFFPMPYIEFGNVQGIITYSKIKGVEKGKKRERTYITDRTNIRSIRCKTDTEVEFEIYFKEACDLTITIGEDSNIGTLTTKAKKGVQTFVIKTKKLTKGETYQIQINYKMDNSSGSFSDNFKANY